MSKKILVTGVSGQDGSYMVDYLLKHTDHLIWGMVRRTSKPDLTNLKNSISNPRFKTIVGDLSDSASIDNVVKEIKPDYFINLAAQSFVGSSWTIPEQTFDVDAMAVIRCLEAIRKHVPNCRFYNAGSSEEHGDVQYSPQDIKHPLRARSPYGAAKIAARQITKVYRESYGLYAIQGLLYNHESERRGEEFVTMKIAKGVARIARAIKDGKPFEPLELGNLDAKRDWSHAEDFVDGIWKMMNQIAYPSGKPDSVTADQHTDLWVKNGWRPTEYILSSGETHAIREFIERSFAIAGIQGLWAGGSGPDEVYAYLPPVSLERLSQGMGVPCLVRINPAFYRPADVELLLGDSTPARRELGWSPKVSFDELVKRMTEAELRAVGL